MTDLFGINKTPIIRIEDMPGGKRFLYNWSAKYGLKLANDTVHPKANQYRSTLNKLKQERYAIIDCIKMMIYTDRDIKRLYGITKGIKSISRHKLQSIFDVNILSACV